MKVLVDKNILYAEMLFNLLDGVQVVSGRTISSATLALADALMVRSVTQVNKHLLEDSQIKFVGTATAGTDHVDKRWLAQAGIHFSSAPGCNAIAVVEYVFSALLWLAQRDNFALRDKIVGIIGVGNIGSRLHQRLKAFGVYTLLCDPPLADAGVHGNWQPLEKLVAEANVLTFHTPLTWTGKYQTKNLVDKILLTAMPDNCILINTCRGAVIDNAALLQILESGKPLSVVLDVWEPEPELLLPLLARVDIGTAHIAGYSLEGKARGTIHIFNAYSGFLGKDMRADLASLLLPVKHIRWHGAIDENTLRQLAYLVYDIRYDDMQLRRVAYLPGKFELLRKNYYQRREWSSILVETDDDVAADQLIQLGFNAQPHVG